MTKTSTLGITVMAIMLQTASSALAAPPQVADVVTTAVQKLIPPRYDGDWSTVRSACKRGEVRILRITRGGITQSEGSMIATAVSGFVTDRRSVAIAFDNVDGRENWKSQAELALSADGKTIRMVEHADGDNAATRSLLYRCK